MEGISQDVINSELLLFDPIRVNIGAQQIQWVEYRPINQLSDNSPVEIYVPGTGSKYIDLKRARLYVKACIKKGNLQDLGENRLCCSLQPFPADISFTSRCIFATETCIFWSSRSCLPCHV